MEPAILNMEITDFFNGEYLIRIEKAENSSTITYNPETRKLHFLTVNTLSQFLKRNEQQLRKILNTKRRETYYVGFTLTFVLRDTKDVTAFNDKSNIIVQDKRNGKNQTYISAVHHQEDGLYRLFTDGSFNAAYQCGAIAILIQDPEGSSQIYAQRTKETNSNLIELAAVIAGLELLRDKERVRIITDSQYVRKGMTEWIINWKLNGWYTANGEKAKHIEHWKRCDQLTENKYIEYKWVKGHSSHLENSLCDYYARALALHAQ